jgi:hypothetical protein
MMKTRGGSDLARHNVVRELDERGRRLDDARAALIREGDGLTPEQILGRISVIEGAGSLEERKLKPVFSGTEGADFHVHQFGREVKKGEKFSFGEEEAHAFWRHFAALPMQDMAVLTHSNIRVLEPEVNADAVYETLMRYKPKELVDKHLWRGMEVKTYSRRNGADGKRLYTGEIGILSLDPTQRIDPWFYEQHTLEEVCERVKADSNLVGFVTHPNAPDGLATGIAREETERLVAEEGLSRGEAKKRVEEADFGVKETARIMQEYGLGTEYHGFYKETLDAAEIGHAVFSRTPLVGGAVSKVTGKAVKIIERMYDVSDYEQASAFMAVGSDAHKTEHIGGARLIVNVPEKKLGEGESLGRVYDVTELDSGLVVLTAHEELRNRALVEAMQDPDVEKIPVLSEPPPEKTFGEFTRRLSRLIEERKAQLSEARITKLGEKQRIA